MLKNAYKLMEDILPREIQKLDIWPDRNEFTIQIFGKDEEEQYVNTKRFVKMLQNAIDELTLINIINNDTNYYHRTQMMDGFRLEHITQNKFNKLPKYMNSVLSLPSDVDNNKHFWLSDEAISTYLKSKLSLPCTNVLRGNCDCKEGKVYHPGHFFRCHKFPAYAIPHNGIRDYLYEKLKELNGVGRVIKERAWSEEDYKGENDRLSHNRSDLEVISISRGFHYVIDVTCVDLRSNDIMNDLNEGKRIDQLKDLMAIRWKAKHDKYKEYISHINNKNRNYCNNFRVCFIPIVISRSGAWYYKSVNLVRELIKNATGGMSPMIKQSANVIIKSWQEELYGILWELNSKALNESVKRCISRNEKWKC